MKQRYNEFSTELYERAFMECFKDKWKRHDVLEFIEKYCGVRRWEIYEDLYEQSCNSRNRAAENCAIYLRGLVNCILRGKTPHDVAPVTVKPRADGMTGKVRNIANLCIQHQLLGHIAKLALDPLLEARILPWQHASIPGRGQTYLKEQAQKFFLSGKLQINCFQKADIHNAYGSTMYVDIVSKLKMEIPSAKHIIKLMTYLGSIAPDGHLIIGGYLDAWMFNYMMSYAIRYMLDQFTQRREIQHRNAMRIGTYMDDFAIFGKTKTGAKRAVGHLRKYLKKEFCMELKLTSSIISMNSVEGERKRRRNKRPSKRGNPCLDMGGYQIHRTYITMRPRVHKRVRRVFMRAYKEIQETGTLRRRHASTLSARFGFVKQTDSVYFQKKYHVGEVMVVAKAVNSYWDRRTNKKKKEWLRNVVYRNTVHGRTRTGRD
jgi:hypothetical protein